MHQRNRITARAVRRGARRRVIVAGLLAVTLAVSGGVILRAAEGPYAPTICRSLTILDPLWWYFQCWLPEDPENGKVG